MIPGPDEIKRRIKRHIKESPDINQKTVAAEVGIQQGYLSEILNGVKGGSFDLIMKIAWAAGIPMTRILAENDFNNVDAEGALVENTINITDHQALVKKFANKQLALEINKRLVQLEKLDPGQLDDVLTIVNEKIRTLERFLKKHTRTAS